MELDLIDRKLLYFLDLNARESLSSVAKRLKIGRNVALYRLNKLKESGIIKGAFAEINNTALGYFSFRIFLKIGNFSSSREKELLQFLTKKNELLWLSKVIGKWDIDLVIMYKSIQEFNFFEEELLLEFNDIIEEKQISILTSIFHFPRDYLISKERKNSNPTILKTDKKVEIDSKDEQLLVILTENAFINIVDISAKLKLSINTVKKKLKSLKNSGVILNYRLFIDTEELGYEYYKLHLSLKNYNKSDIQKLKSWLSSNANVIYIDHYINGEDFEIELHLKNESEYLSFYNELKNQFSNIIKGHFLLKFYDNMIYKYLPIK